MPTTNQNSDTSRRNGRSGNDSPSSMNRTRNDIRRNRNDRRTPPTAPRSLLRDRPLAEPRRHQPTPLVTMSGNISQQQRPTATTNSPAHYTTNETTTSQPYPAIPSTPSPSSPPSGQSSPFLPGIDEGSSDFRYPHNKQQEKKLSTHTVSTVNSSSDSEIDSGLEFENSIHSSNSSSSSVDFDYENDDDNEISCSIRSTQSMPPMTLTPVSRRRCNSASRRTSSSSKRSHRSFPAKHSKIPRSTSVPSTPAMAIPPPPFVRQSRRLSYPPVTQCYQTTTNTKASPSKSKLSKRQCLKNFLLSGICLQLLLLVAIGLLVAWSRSQATFANDTLLRLKEAESKGLLNLHRLESHSMHVHELMRNRLIRASGKNKDTDDLEDLYDGEYPEEVIDPEDDPLRDQYQQLTEMANDLRNHADVTALQSSLQDTAIDEIINTYGEGPVKVVVELDFGDKPVAVRKDKNNRQARHTHHMAKGTYISIILWPDTPHAAWAWLEQIGRNIWDGSSVQLNPSSTLLKFQPTKDDPMERGHLEFVEGHPSQETTNPDMNHGAWTIGLRETVGDADRKGRLEMFINLADNQEERKHETCIGKIFDGFDALQRLLEGTDVSPSGEAHTNVSVKSVSAMHLTHQELQQIYR